MSKFLHILYGAIIFILLALSIIGFSYCGNYKSRCQRLSQSLIFKNTESENLRGELETLREQLKAKTNEADMLNSALLELRKQMYNTTTKKAGRPQ